MGIGPDPVGVRGVKPRALLVVLLLRAGRRVSLDAIQEALWDGEPPRSAVANIRTHASALRTALCAGAASGAASRAGALAGGDGGYTLHAEPGDCDHLRFLESSAAGRAALLAGDAARATRLLGPALGLWDGDRAAVGVPRLGPLAGALDHLDEERMRAVEDLAEAHLWVGEPRAALRDLTGLLASAPLRSRSWALRMRAHHRIGELGGVSESYRAACAVFRDELGIAPGGELRSLYAELTGALPRSA
ncbi:AfsR/SARP family transcriptional regulator [Streptomyces lucensis]|uniref:AfsR/SARP family transcriptional regulator n=1 Tax=Streptomyces lucensis TaxID=67319 RepID=UPI0016719506|nr:AfsR/SARP family transcriptional regulator [Streptomyces lucensis]